MMIRIHVHREEKVIHIYIQKEKVVTHFHNFCNGMNMNRL